LASACAGQKDPPINCEGDPPEIVRPDFWAVDSHCPGTEPDYDKVFDDQVVHRFDIVISSENYEAMMEDMDEKFSGGSMIPDPDALPVPIYVPVTVHYDGKEWTNVGMRWKGHSSLKAAWQSGVRKLAFRLSFDHFESSDASLRDQRFFGFDELSFANGYNDSSLLRDKVGADIFRAAGVPAARGTFAAVYLDWEDESAYLGLYTMIEDPADQMLEAQIGEGSGNLYKPWGDAARWLPIDELEEGQDEFEIHFEPKTNESSTDWSDVIAAIEALHAEPGPGTSEWRSGLEEVFDVQTFLEVLAVNQTIVNWDSYGCMHHNYYVYANPLDGGRLLWFPWDLNESMLYRTQGGCPDPGSVMLDEIVHPDPENDEIDADWPLIGLLLADDEYFAAYCEALRATLDDAFVEETVITELRRQHDLIAPYVVGPEEVEDYPYTNCTADGFNGSLTEGETALEPHVSERRAAVEAALAE